MIVTFPGYFHLCCVFIYLTDLYDSQITNVSLAPIGNSSNFSGVVIVTYMRSGSSLTGDILQQSPGAFYVYEPLHAIGNMVKKPAVPNLTFMNGTTRYDANLTDTLYLS